jgi:hypothetical protein
VNRPKGDGDKPQQGAVANTLNSFRNGAVGFIDWLDGFRPCSKRQLSNIEKKNASSYETFPSAASPAVLITSLPPP